MIVKSRVLSAALLALLACPSDSRAQSPRPQDPARTLAVEGPAAPVEPRLLKVATQPPQQPTSAAQEGYVPADQLPKPQDTLPAAPLLATAYAFVWLMLFGYMFSIWRRLASVEREMESVNRRIGSPRGPTP